MIPSRNLHANGDYRVSSYANLTDERMQARPPLRLELRFSLPRWREGKPGAQGRLSSQRRQQAAPPRPWRRPNQAGAAASCRPGDARRNGRLALTVEPPIKPGTPDPYTPPRPGELRAEEQIQLGVITQFVTALVKAEAELPQPDPGIRDESDEPCRRRRRCAAGHQLSINARQLAWCSRFGSWCERGRRGSCISPR